MPLSASEKLRRFYDRFSGEDRVLIVINADPDAIASAMAAKRLLWRRVGGVTIAHVNIINRPDNIAMIRLLGVPLVYIEEIAPAAFNRWVIVDSQPCHHHAFAPMAFDVIIDHHPESDAKAPFKDIRPKYGATATILTEYLRAARIKPSAKLATGLFLAIKTDTRNFERESLIEDVRAFQFLYRHANIHLARKIEQSELRLDFLKYFKHALETMRMRRGRIFVHLGKVVNPDVCVLVADFFMRVNPVKWSVISGIHQEKLILILRNDGLRKNAGRVAKQSFGRFGSAGGHKSMARAEIPLFDLEPLIDPEDDRAMERWVVRQLEKKAEKIRP